MKGLGLSFVLLGGIAETIRGGSAGRFQVTSYALKGDFGTIVYSSPFSHVLDLR